MVEPALYYSDDNMKPKALIILHDGIEELEAVAPIDILRRGGVEVITTADTTRNHIKGRSEIKLSFDTPLSEVAVDMFDCIVLPGGPGIVQTIRPNPQIAQLLKQQFDKNKWIAAICAAPLILSDAGILNNKHYTAHLSTIEALPEIKTGASVVVDAPVITSSGAGTAIEFALTILTKLTSLEKAKEIADNILFKKNADEWWWELDCYTLSAAPETSASHSGSAASNQ